MIRIITKPMLVLKKLFALLIFFTNPSKKIFSISYLETLHRYNIVDNFSSHCYFIRDIGLLVHTEKILSCNLCTTICSVYRSFVNFFLLNC